MNIARNRCPFLPLPPAALVAVACCLSGSLLRGAELLTNGSFTAGNMGFQTDYANYYDGVTTQQTYTASGSYTIGTNPSQNAISSEAFADIGDHTTGTGNMLEVDGDAAGNRFWYETVNVTPNTAYTFSFWGASIDARGNNTPATIEFSVNGVAVGSSAMLAAVSTGNTANAWTKYTYL